MTIEVQTYTMVVTSGDDYVTTMTIEHYDWWDGCLRVFTSTSMNHFSIDNIKSVTVDGVSIEVPVL